jgi:hypothetical protein
MTTDELMALTRGASSALRSRRHERAHRLSERRERRGSTGLPPCSRTLRENGTIAINPIIYAEVSVAFRAIEDVETALPRDYFVRTALPWEAAFPPRGHSNSIDGAADRGEVPFPTSSSGPMRRSPA